MPDRRILVATDGSAEQQGAERDLARRAERLRIGGLQVDTLVRVGSEPEVVVEVDDAVGVDCSSSFPDSLYSRAL